MVDNQHKQISGYRDFSQEEIDTINEIKSHEEVVAGVYKDLMSLPNTDKRWANIGRTHLQEGFSALVRSVARPENPFED